MLRWRAYFAIVHFAPRAGDVVRLAAHSTFEARTIFPARENVRVQKTHSGFLWDAVGFFVGVFFDAGD